jgi:transposase-like protein
MDRTGSIKLWRRLLASVVPGEMTVQQWCEQQGVTQHQYYYWRRRVAAVADEKTAEGQPSFARVQPWLAVEVVEPTSVPTPSGGVTVRVAGAAIELHPGFDPAMLRAVVNALAVRPC